MQTGIIGLPQVGKTTLFRILTRAHLDEKSARAATHIGVARVPEPRIDQLAALYKPRKVTYATVDYVDVGGMAEGRARDSGVLAPLREVDALAHVLRVFDDPAVPHSAGSIDPLRDAVTLDLELMLSDLDQIERRLERLEKDLKKKKEPAAGARAGSAAALPGVDFRRAPAARDRVHAGRTQDPHRLHVSLAASHALRA